MVRKRMLGTVATAVVAVGISAGVANPASQAAPVPVLTAMTFNVHGGLDRHGNGNNGEVKYILRDTLKAVDTYKPHVIGFQEICRSPQDRTIRKELAKRGYVGTMSYLKPDRACGEDQTAGISLYVKAGKILERKRTNLPWGANPVGTVGRQPRALLCLTAVMQGKNWRVCNTHLSPRNPDNANQLRRVSAVIAPYAAGQLVLVGDLNVGQTTVASAFSKFKYAGRGVDWVVASRPTRLLAVVPAPSSDHPIVIATVTG